MEMTFKSKLGLELIVPVSVILGGISILFILKGIWPGLIIVVGLSAFIIHTFITTEYTINSNNLQIRSGLFFNKIIDIESIRKVAETRVAMSSPAMSIDRLEVFYNKFDTLIISPKDKKEFIKQLKIINDQIEVKLKESASH